MSSLISSQHIVSYPLVIDSISTIKSNPYGAKSINMAHNLSHHIVTPVLPYAQRPYGYVAPYMAKVDELADSSLNLVDDTFPMVRSDAKQLQGGIKQLIFFPIGVAMQGRDYVFSTYGNEYQKCGGQTYLDGGKALITTGLVITSDSLAWLSSFLTQKQQEAKEVVREKTNN